MCLEIGITGKCCITFDTGSVKIFSGGTSFAVLPLNMSCQVRFPATFVITLLTKVESPLDDSLSLVKYHETTIA